MPWSHKIPDDAERPCDRPGCDGRYVIYGRPHFDADGSAMVGLICSKRCGTESVHYWNWKW